MFPTVLSTTIAPFSTRQRAGERSLVMTHSSRFRPSNRTIASDGAAPSPTPGNTLGGTGSHCSVSSGLADAPVSLPEPSLNATLLASITARLHKSISLSIRFSPDLRLRHALPSQARPVRTEYKDRSGPATRRSALP